ncbi:hypothetical protein HMSSN036_12120 [Paenibacillus macerans]|nr:hypothetical protein HMSSN036_12120 [Paenibacillus macerans]
MHWQYREPFYNPDKYITMECPDYFQMGDWHYLVYSTFSEKFVTHYKKSKTIEGVYTSPIPDTFDGRGFTRRRRPRTAGKDTLSAGCLPSGGPAITAIGNGPEPWLCTRFIKAITAICW